jgi:hypothetical protein
MNANGVAGMARKKARRLVEVVIGALALVALVPAPAFADGAARLVREFPELLQSDPDCVPGSGYADATFVFGPSSYFDGFGPLACWPGYDCRYVETRVAAPMGDELANGSILYRCSWQSIPPPSRADHRDARSAPAVRSPRSGYGSPAAQ